MDEEPEKCGKHVEKSHQELMFVEEKYRLISSIIDIIVEGHTKQELYVDLGKSVAVLAMNLV